MDRPCTLLPADPAPFSLGPPDLSMLPQTFSSGPGRLWLWLATAVVGMAKLALAVCCPPEQLPLNVVSLSSDSCFRKVPKDWRSLCGGSSHHLPDSLQQVGLLDREGRGELRCRPGAGGRS